MVLRHGHVVAEERAERGAKGIRLVTHRPFVVAGERLRHVLIEVIEK